MKKKYTFLFFLISVIGFAQFNPSAPWMSETVSSTPNEVSVYKISELFNEYWKTHNKDAKGSGYKPYKRWEYHWRNKINEQGYLITPQEMWYAWNQKNQTRLNRNSAFSTPTSNWTPVGPFSHTNTGSWSSGQGRVNIVAVDPNNPNTIYLGAPAGGIWKSTDAGINWTPLSDNLPQIGVSGIAIDHTDSNIIYIATGDKDAYDTYSVGVLKSTNGGTTWATTGLTFAGTSAASGDIIMHPTNNQILWCATSSGLYRTINGGTNWSVVQSGNFSQGNIRLKPNDPSIVYAVTATKFYRSTNTGSSFSEIMTGLPTSSGRLVMDVTPANPEYIYILSAKTNYSFQGVYRSTNGGTSFSARNTTTNVLESSQAWFDLALAVSDIDEEEIYTGCLNVWKSNDGGSSFVKINNWSSPASETYTHADIHYLGFLAGKLYCGSDGGIYVSENEGFNFTDLTATAQISQFYKISVSKQSSNNMVGGLQDNGGHAYSGGIWKNYYGADGMDTAIDPNNSNLYYGFTQNGGGLYISNSAGNAITGTVNSPNGEDGNWVTPLAINSIGELFSGFSNLYKLSGSSWVLQNSGNIGSGNIELIEIDPLDDNVIYVANGTSLYMSSNRGVNFSPIYVAHANITSIEVNNTDSSIIYLTTSGSSGRVLKSTDGGTSFTNITTGIPNIGKNCIVHQGRHSDNPLFVATSLGVYYRDDTMSTWEPFDTGLPNVSVEDLEINLEDGKLIAATFGRGVWQTDIPVQLASDDIKFISILSPGIDINCQGNIIPQIEVKNNGLNVISSVLVNYSINGTPYNFNWNGTINSTENTLISLPSVLLSRGVHTISVNTAIANEVYINNNSGTATFYVNNSGIVGNVNTFSNSSDELISYKEAASGALWVRGNRTSGVMSTSGNLVYTTNLSGNYPNATKGYLVSQCYNLSNVINPEISFSMKFDLETNWDVIYVQYSTNFGATWTVLGSAGTNWYNSSRTPGNDCYNCPGAQWTGADTTIKTYSLPLNTLNSETNIIFRFVFHSDESVNRPGVNIDNFVINGTLPSQSFELQNIVLYPNPSKGIFNVALGTIEPTTIEVYDLTGKIIWFKKDIIVSNSEVLLDLSNISQGVYFVKITANKQSTVKRIIKE